MLFSGSIPALITPFRDGQVDFDTLAQLIEWQITEGSSGLVICGTTGECPTLSYEEQYDVIAFAVRQTNQRIPIIAGASSNSTREALQLTEYAEKAGANGLLHATGYYNKPSQVQVVEHFKAINAHTTLPILIYNVPSRAGIEFSVDCIAALAELERVVGIKDATGNVARISQERLRISRPFAYLSGDDGTALGYIAHGGHGCISVTANVVPRLYADFIAAGLSGDFMRAQQLQQRMIALHIALFAEPSPGGTKYALAKQGRCAQELRLPLTPVTQAARERIDAALALLEQDNPA